MKGDPDPWAIDRSAKIILALTICAAIVFVATVRELIIH